MTLFTFIYLSLIVLGGGATMLAFGIKWELEYKKGFNGKTNGEIVSITPRSNLCDLSYTYMVDTTKSTAATAATLATPSTVAAPYTGVSRRDCIFTAFSKVEIAYRKKEPQCSRMTSGFSDLNTGYDDLTACDGTANRIIRQVLISFGVIFIVVYFICLTFYLVSLRTKKKPVNPV
jgi:hypothetical protein